MSVRAKMRCTSKHETTDITGGADRKSVKVTLQPVYGTGQEDANTQWSKWTPSGELTLHITNPAAYEQLELGKAYYVDLSPTEE